MRRAAVVPLLWLCVACSSAPVYVVRTQSDVGGEVFTGLVFASAERLARIPVASTPCGDGDGRPEVDLSRFMPPPGEQGQLGSCTAWAIAYAIKSFQESQEEKWSLFDREGRRDLRHIFSPAFIYNTMRAKRDIPANRDDKVIGIPFDEALEFVKENGVAPWADMPYTDQDFKTQPSAAALSAAKPYRIQGYKQVPRDVLSLKSWLASGVPILFAAGADKEFGTAWNRPGYMWESGEDPQSAHAMVLVGYSDRLKAFKLMNSWGTRWGDGGYGWIPYSRVGVIREAYILHDAKNARSEHWREDRNEVEAFLSNAARFQITNVQHGATYADRPDLGTFMRFDGTLDAPPGIGRNVQVAVHFYLDEGGNRKGAALRSRDTQYATSGGQAACGSQRYEVAENGLRTSWSTWLPYKVLIVPEERWMPKAGDSTQVRCAVLAEASLFVDTYQVCTAKPIPFEVTASRRPVETKLTAERAKELFRECYEAHNAGDYGRAIEGYRKIAQAMPKEELGYLSAYNIACAYALSGRKKEALDWLESSIRNGYRDIDHIERDSDLNSIRREGRFRQLVKGTTTSAPSAVVQEVTVDHNLVRNGEYGMQIRVKFGVEGFKGGRGWVGAYFSFADGTVLRDYDGTYKSDDGTVSTGDYIHPQYDSTRYDDLRLYIPYSQLHLKQGLKHDLLFNLWIMGEIDGQWKALSSAAHRTFFVVDYSR